MSRAATFKKTDVTRATRAVLAAGLDVERVEIDKSGRIIVVPSKSGESGSLQAPNDEWKIVA
jgi:hypothetical protein